MKICVGDMVEISSNEAGFQDSYYEARVIRKLGKDKVLVEYSTLLSDDDDQNQQLMEVVGVYSVRPVPPQLVVSDFNVLDKVDAYDNEGWWIGRITGRDFSNYYVYFDCSGDEYAYSFHRLRIHQEYENGQWIPSP